MSNEKVFLIILIVNTLIAVVYLIVGLVVGKRKKNESGQKKQNRTAYVIKFFVMLLCPVIGLVIIAFSHLLYLTIFRRDVDLEDVIFSKERVKTHERADEDRERNLAPMEEAIAVSDQESLRNLMLNVIRGNTQDSLAAISLALNSSDSETSHYAASVLQDELNNFRVNVQKIFHEIEAEDESQTEYEHMLLSYMEHFLEQKVFTEVEQENMVNTFVEAGEILYKKASYQMTSEYYKWICLNLLDIQDFERAEMWCNRAYVQYPEELSSYTCKLKLYFTAEMKEKFFATMEELKQSNIVIDRETLELIRTFS